MSFKRLLPILVSSYTFQSCGSAKLRKKMFFLSFEDLFGKFRVLQDAEIISLLIIYAMNC